MREILFRGKRVGFNEWIEGYYFQRKNNECVEGFIAAQMSECAAEFKPVYPETVGQYTGLTDKNGKKIFEGDILKYSYHPPVIVVWHSGGWYFTDEDDPSKPHPDDFIDNWSYTDKEKLEIIGNIHDIPELLEAGV